MTPLLMTSARWPPHAAQSAAADTSRRRLLDTACSAHARRHHQPLLAAFGALAGSRSGADHRSRMPPRGALALCDDYVSMTRRGARSNDGRAAVCKHGTYVLNRRLRGNCLLQY
eukprot:SAG31_NODE_4994_length_2813_cov_1.546593_2_plen_114_part_00